MHLFSDNSVYWISRIKTSEPSERILSDGSLALAVQITQPPYKENKSNEIETKKGEDYIIFASYYLILEIN